MTYVANFPNCGYVGHEYNVQDLIPIRQEIKDIQNNWSTKEQTDHTFTSTVKKEYKIQDSLEHLEKLVCPLVGLYYENFHIDQAAGKPYLHSAWVNFQEKGEFFAPHTHVGEFSFALYLQVPFTYEQERKYHSTKDKKIDTASGFVFYYTDILGNIIPSYLPVDKTWENKIIFFPGQLLHSVQPFFTSDDYRITISGNVRFK